MLAIEATTFSGYSGLRQTDLPRPPVAQDRAASRRISQTVEAATFTLCTNNSPCTRYTCGTAFNRVFTRRHR
jgi:hypothetical protein